MNIGIILPNWVGDVAMATPALRALDRHFGARARLTGIMRPYVTEVLAGTSWLHDSVLYDHRSRGAELRTWPVLCELRRRRFDLLLLLSNSLRTGVVARLSGAKERVGYCRNWRGWCLTKRLLPPREAGRLRPISAVDYYLEITSAVGCSPERRQLELATTAADERAADEVWRELDLGSAEGVVVLNTGSAAGTAKSWPTAHFTMLARRIARRMGFSVLVVCGPAERATAATIEREAAHPRVRSLAHFEPGLGLTKACIRRSRLLVTTDSGPRHFAAAFGVPAVSLFGPTDPRWADNYHPGEIQLRLDLPCSPCSKRICPLGHHACMRELSVEQVLSAVARQLGCAHPPADSGVHPNSHLHLLASHGARGRGVGKSFEKR